MLWWNLFGFKKMRTERHYTELVFLHPVGSTDHVVHFGAFGEQNVDALFLMLV
jgi:hypothetical protein